MKIDDVSKKKLRLLINDKEKEIFSDDELELILSEADCINCAAAQAWLLKATKYETTIGETYEYKIGDESYKGANIKDLVSVAFQNADRFKSLCLNSENIGSTILKIDTNIEL